jgi:hypothetical protein
MGSPTTNVRRGQRPGLVAVKPINPSPAQECFELLGMLADELAVWSNADKRGDDVARSHIEITRDELYSLLQDLKAARGA